jgi:Alpha amylase, catalytic domain
MKRQPSLILLVCLLLCLGSVHQCFGVLANAWHIPDNTTGLGLNMRNPEFEIGTSTAVTVYSGIQKYNNPYGTANQIGGTLYYKGASQGTWSSTNLQWYLNGGPSTNNQYWQASFNSSSVGTNEVIQYYLYLTFDGVNGVQNTYLYGGDGDSTTTATQSTAANAPFTIRNRAAWLFHAGNRVISPGSDGSHNNVDFWIKLGYIGKDSSLASRWADHASAYYTTDGSNPAGALGVPSGTSQAAALSLDHVEGDASPAGNAMWWQGTGSNLPTFTTIKYKIGVWHSSNNEEKFADYNAGAPNTVFSFSMGTNGDPALTVNGLNADYTTTHVFVDETVGDSIPLTILFSPNASGVTTAEVFSNLNRRERAAQDANGDGIEDGIVPPDGNVIVAGDDSNYYKAYAMTSTGTNYALTLNAQKTGAYRLTARYKVTGNTNWFWYSSSPRRDHAIVVAPKKARNISLYELNAMNIGSAGTQDYQRSTFTDFYNGPGSRPYDPVTNRFNLAYAQNLGVNWLWFQPIHPVGVDGRQTDPDTGQPYSVGSPYSVKNFFQVNPLMSKANTRDAALTEFTNFVAAADSAGVNVMLDAAFNHTSWDGELDASGVYYFATNAAPSDQFRNREARFYSRTDAYDMRAFDASSVAPAPDRYDFGKWSDVHDVFFGRYAALVPNSSQTTAYLNEGDWFDYTIGSESASGSGNGHFDGMTRNVWRYFSDYILYWLDKTGCPSGTPASQTYRGIDGLRADFGQGLAPQCWEYIINKARSRKWDFVFMSESLDGGAVTYRSNRHFDILNENIVFPLKSAVSASDYRNIFEDRRNAYGQGLVLLNSTSHDEENYDDPFQALIRYTVCGSIDGAPMIFYGQELGITRTNGFDLYELNFGKKIPQFKKYNSLQPIFHNRALGVDFLWPVYAAVNQARGFSAALRSSNRYFINQTGSGNPQPSIFSVVKYEQPNGSPNFYDVVFAFANLDRNNQQQGSFNVNITQNGGNLFGIKLGRTYNVRNIAAYTAYDGNRRNYWLWPGSGTAGSNVLANGIFVSLNPVPGTDGGWTNAPFEAQYLKLYDVTPPAAPSAPATPKPYAIGTSATFSWPALADPDGGISAYHVEVGTSPGGSNVLNLTVAGTTATATNTYGQTLYARVSAINNAGIEGSFSPNSTGTILLDPNGDYDHDGMSNAAEDIAGTNPLNINSVLRILGLAGGNQLTWSSVSGKTYRVFATADLTTNFVPISGIVTGAGPTASYLDSPATNSSRFYRVNVLP